MQTPKQITEKCYRAATFFPGLSEQELSQFRRELGGLIPNEIEELLLYSAGFAHKPQGTVCFTGHEGFGFEEAFPLSVALLPDGCGNFWVIDINPESGAWGSVFYVCHDPPVIVVQAPELGVFLSQVLDPNYSKPKNALNFVRKEAAMRIWGEDPWLISAHDARLAEDAVVSAFAKRLPDNFRIADLRSKKVGSGFSWGLAGPNTIIQRCGADLLFGVEQKPPGFLRRILTRRKQQKRR